MDIARLGIEVGREAIEQAGKKDEVALAFSINGDIDGPARREFIELLPRAFEDDPPDLILLETITLIRDGLTLAAIEALVATGIPGVDQLPPLPPRRVRRLRPALGRAGGRRVRPRRAPPGRAGRARAAHQLPAA